MDLEDFAQDKETLAVEYRGGVCNVTYRPSKVTYKAIGDANTSTVDYLSDVLVSWDLTKNKKKVPITPQSLEDLPMPFLRAVSLAIMRGSASTGEAKANSSSG